MALWQGTLGEKEEFKKAIAKMMVFWVVQTRQNLRADLIKNDPNGVWKLTGLETVFAATPSEWTNFFSDVSAHYQDSLKQLVADSNNLRADASWVRIIVPLCPPNEVIKAMFECAMSFVEDQWTVI
ncbi:MAG: hypothetical protein AB1631_13470 [Acidobacteriota bacterium]